MAQQVGIFLKSVKEKDHKKILILVAQFLHQA